MSSLQNIIKNFTLVFVLFFIPILAHSQTGAWVISIENARYQFGGPRFPNHMANYKDESVIIAGLQAATGPGAPSSVFIDRSKDAGKTWHRLYTKDPDEAGFAFYQIAHPTAAHIIAIVEKFAKDSTGKDVKQHFVIASADTGSTWTTHSLDLSPVEYAKSLHFLENVGILTVTTANKNELWYTNDYGTSWQKKDLPTALSYSEARLIAKDEIIFVTRVNPTGAYIKGIHSSNNNFQYFSLPQYFGAYFFVLNENIIWSATSKSSGQGLAKNNYIVNSNDKGQNWQTRLDVFEDNPYHRQGVDLIAFVDSLRGVAIGTNVSYHTENGGIDWEKRDMQPAENVIQGFESMAYYYNPLTRKTMLLSLLKNMYVMRYDFEADVKDTGTVGIFNPTINTVSFNIYPNPASTFLNVEFTDNNLNATNYSMKIISIDGRVISNSNISSVGTFKHTLPIDNLSKGSYLIQVVSSSGITNKLFIKE